MKNWKKLLTLVLAMVLCLSISACGGDSGDGGETADAPAVLEDYAYICIVPSEVLYPTPAPLR